MASDELVAVNRRAVGEEVPERAAAGRAAVGQKPAPQNGRDEVARRVLPVIVGLARQIEMKLGGPDVLVGPSDRVREIILPDGVGELVDVVHREVAVPSLLVEPVRKFKPEGQVQEVDADLAQGLPEYGRMFAALPLRLLEKLSEEGVHEEASRDFARKKGRILRDGGIGDEPVPQGRFAQDVGKLAGAVERGLVVRIDRHGAAGGHLRAPRAALAARDVARLDPACRKEALEKALKVGIDPAEGATQRVGGAVERGGRFKRRGFGKRGKEVRDRKARPAALEAREHHARELDSVAGPRRSSAHGPHHRVEGGAAHALALEGRVEHRHTRAV